MRKERSFGKNSKAVAMMRAMPGTTKEIYEKVKLQFPNITKDSVRSRMAELKNRECVTKDEVGVWHRNCIMIFSTS